MLYFSFLVSSSNAFKLGLFIASLKVVFKVGFDFVSFHSIDKALIDFIACNIKFFHGLVPRTLSNLNAFFIST